MPEIRLVEIPEDGDVGESADEWARWIVGLTRDFYPKVGFVRPWVGYLACEGDAIVGCCGFKGPPVDGRVEIAYGAAPGCEGRGVATALAGLLVEISRRADPTLIVAARTLPGPGASPSVLKKNGFVYHGEVQDPEDGLVWEYRRPDAAG